MIRRTALVLVVCCVSFSFFSCQQREAVARTPVAPDQKAASVAVAPDPPADQYTPPADGRLTGAQIDNFIKVRQRAKVIESEARHELEVQAQNRTAKDSALVTMIAASTPIGNFVSADLRAAKDLGLNEAEYEWVRQEMIAASMAATADKGLVLAARTGKEERAKLQESYDTAPDENSKATYAGMIADSEKNEKDAVAAVEPQSAAVIYNKELLAKHEDAIRPLMELLMPGTGHEKEIDEAVAKYNAIGSATPAP